MTQHVDVRIDADACIGSAMCRLTAPSLFVEGGGGKSTVAPDGSVPTEAILEAADLCPAGAITVRDAETGDILES